MTFLSDSLPPKPNSVPPISHPGDGPSLALSPVVTSQGDVISPLVSGGTLSQPAKTGWRAGFDTSICDLSRNASPTSLSPSSSVSVQGVHESPPPYTAIPSMDEVPHNGWLQQPLETGSTDM
jgi:hypothetical protein